MAPTALCVYLVLGPPELACRPHCPACSPSLAWVPLGSLGVGGGEP